MREPFFFCRVLRNVGFHASGSGRPLSVPRSGHRDWPTATTDQSSASDGVPSVTALDKWVMFKHPLATRPKSSVMSRNQRKTTGGGGWKGVGPVNALGSYITPPSQKKKGTTRTLQKCLTSFVDRFNSSPLHHFNGPCPYFQRCVNCRSPRRGEDEQESNADA